MTETATAAPVAPADDAGPALTPEQSDLDAMCERWIAWGRTRRLYGPSPVLFSSLGQLARTSTRPLRRGGVDAFTSAELSAFHIAYTCQPDALDKQVFEAYYLLRIKPVKAAAAALGISRPHFYRLLDDFRNRVHRASLAILAENQSPNRA